MITTVDPVREYVEEMATADVRATIDWLDRAGFRLAASQGGRGEAFGNALLVFSLDLAVRIVRDRGQWDIAVSLPDGSAWFGLAIVTDAREGRDWQPPAITRDGDLPEQLPDGLSWRDHLPPALAWLRQPGSEAVLQRANARARWRQRQHSTHAEPPAGAQH
jgi:hypothetical protein